MKKKVKFSNDEIKLLYLPVRVPTRKIAEKLKLDANTNVLDKVDIDLTPYLIDPMSLVGKSDVHWIFLIAPTQSGKTLFLQTVVADAIAQDSGTMIYILPDEKSGKKALKEKVINLINANEFLRKHKIFNKLHYEKIELKHMTIYPGWSGSLASLSSTPAKRVILDEIRLMKLFQGDESNAIKLAGDRVTTYYRMGMGQAYGVSTPSIEGDLLHQQLSVKGTHVLYWAYKCPKCGFTEVLDFFKNVKKDKETRKVYCACSACGYQYDESNLKKGMNKHGKYVKKNIDGSLEEVQISKLKGRVVFWYDSIASPFRSFDAIYEEFIQTKDKLHDYKNFWQAWLARFWIDDISKTSIAQLSERKVVEERGIVPDWCQLLTAGVDSQGNGFYVSVFAWGHNRKTRMIDEFFIDCPVATSTSEDVYKLFDREIESKIYRNNKGSSWVVGMWAIDTGGNRTKQIYEACANLDRVIPVKGKNAQNTTIVYNAKINLYLVRTIEYLEETEERATNHNVSFELHKSVSYDFLNQFTNIRKVRKKNRTTGEETLIWKRVGQYDYRMAVVHAYICLDVPTNVGTFRREIEHEDFQFNPLVRKIEEQAEIPTENNFIYDDYSDNNDNEYDIGGMEGW